MEELHTLNNKQFQCTSLQQDAYKSMEFCRPLINYDVALPKENPDIDTMVTIQDAAASTAYFYHLAGLGYEGWDYQDPADSDNECVKAIWRMTCYTFFPKAEIGCQPGADSIYLRPCRSSCHNYIQQCEVQCCDESVQCVFTHEKELPGDVKVFTEGYSPHDGPSSSCTGAAEGVARYRCFVVMLGPLLGLLQLLGLFQQQT